MNRDMSDSGHREEGQRLDSEFDRTVLDSEK